MFFRRGESLGKRGKIEKGVGGEKERKGGRAREGDGGGGE